MYICEKCNREFKSLQGLNSHKGFHNKPDRISNFSAYNEKVRTGEIKKKNGNQFLKAQNEGRLIFTSDETKKKIGDARRGKPLTKKWRKNISESMKIAVKKYIEVKGYERDRDREKWKMLKNLIIIKHKEIQLIKNNKYGLLSALAHNQLKP